MAQIQCQTISISLEHATPEQFYSVFNPPYLHLRDICSKMGTDIQIAADYFHATIKVSCPDGETRKIEVEVVSIEPPKKTTNYRAWTVNDPSSEHEIKLEVTDNRNVKWTVCCPPPADDYLNFLESVSKAVDNHIAKN
ncbi:hypothetical protein D5086_008081 [Populus alba]|uniref:Uncharacterized protein n=3 Tax=Populus TaxID=3689 RepID=A0ACC4CEB0_POPAL|nr:uncharacterized protein LOC118047274 [Populus alba]KAJ6999877.1 hypothetical protein NC653_010583 [Populus alba x Populus x berolinensis]TKR58068.1 hypothetical protein D5086_0000328520 [Populus alba]